MFAQFFERSLVRADENSLNIITFKHLVITDPSVWRKEVACIALIPVSEAGTKERVGSRSIQSHRDIWDVTSASTLEHNNLEKRTVYHRIDLNK
jgi:hypothetical protein